MGRVILSSGLDWVRYWVAFENGVEVGSLHRDKLVREAEWDAYLCSVNAVKKSLKMTEGQDTSPESDTQSSGSGGVEVNGVLVPQLLLDRTKAALERLELLGNQRSGCVPSKSTVKISVSLGAISPSPAPFSP